MKEIGMEYQAIDACPNDHIIYYGQYASENKCPQCELSRYRIDKVTKKVLRKVLCYIPIIPCFQWLQVPKYSTIYGLPRKEHK